MSDNKRAKAIPDFITKEYLLERFEYKPETGEIFRKRDGKKLGYTNRLGYIRCYVAGATFQAHWLVWMMHYGEWPADQVDHINRNPADNRIANLRISNYPLNAMNRGASTRNRTGRIGVHERDGMWVAKIRFDGKSRYIGRYNTPEEAEAAYLRAKKARIEEMLADDVALRESYLATAKIDAAIAAAGKHKVEG